MSDYLPEHRDKISAAYDEYAEALKVLQEQCEHKVVLEKTNGWQIEPARSRICDDCGYEEHLHYATIGVWDKLAGVKGRAYAVEWQEYCRSMPVRRPHDL